MSDPKDDKIKIFSDGKEEIKNHNDIIEKTINIIKKNIDIDANLVAKLECYKNTHEYSMKMLEDIPKVNVELMSNSDFSGIMTIVNSLGIAGEASSLLFEESKNMYALKQHHFATAATLNTMAYSDSSSVQAFSIINPRLFPDGVRITNEYKIQDELNKQIKYVGDQLQNDFPSLKDEYDDFIKKYQIFRGNNSQYQDIIGGRSLFFYKMIFDFAENEYSTKYPRLNCIKRFVFGSATVIPSTLPLLKACDKLYKDISNQDSSGNSVKLGKVTPIYIESIFRRLIGNIYAILELRDNYFKQ
jgi:hypothetical protein